MADSYRPILWNRQKKLYDLWLWIGIVCMIGIFIGAELFLFPDITIETAIIRSTAFTAFCLLHIILIIGPLCRLYPSLLPLLYNRRHLGVSMFLIATIHAIFSIIQFHSLADTNPFLSIFTSNEHYSSISAFPFQVLGFFAFLILLLMAASSHDFWLKNLSPKVWKSLHMGVYLAYGLIIGHVLLGTLQYEDHPLLKWSLGIGFLIVAGLHIIAGLKSLKDLQEPDNKKPGNDGFMYVADVSDIKENRGKSIFINGENIALFKYEGKISAVHNVCKHQMGPLGEGKVIDGCITCPWHGYQYHPHNGQSPPPFKEKLCTYRVKVIGDEIWVNPNPLEEGTETKPAIINQKG